MIEKKYLEALIERYLTGKLDLRELAAIEDEIKTNKGFADLVTFKRNLLLGINEIKKQELKQRLNRIELGKKRVINLYEIRTAFHQYSVAASIIVILSLAISFIYYSNRPKEIGSKIANMTFMKAKIENTKN